MMNTPEASPVTRPVSTTELAGLTLLRRGKVRDVYDLGERLLIVATDRLSAFDVILPDPIPMKGAVLTAISAFWFAKTEHLIANHIVSMDVADYPPECAPHAATLLGRSMLVKKTRPLPVECVMRGYLAGSAWKEYRESQSVCGIPLPAGLMNGSKLPEPIFTPATKAESGHDENVSFERTVEILGAEAAETVREASLILYRFASAYALERAIIIADTKFEFGYDGDEIILIDEALTPDSSRFWPVAGYTPGEPQVSFDKQFVRDYLETLDWDKTPPAPSLPRDVIERTTEKYIEAHRLLTGQTLDTEQEAEASDPDSASGERSEREGDRRVEVGTRMSENSGEGLQDEEPNVGDEEPNVEDEEQNVEDEEPRWEAGGQGVEEVQKIEVDEISKPPIIKERQPEHELIPRHPFNDYKHAPTRPDIDQTLGMRVAIELRRFEELLELYEMGINWSMEWYDAETGWGYRASFNRRVVCVLNFYNGHFTATFSIPDSKEKEFLTLRELTPHVRLQMRTFKKSMKAKWFTIRLWKREDVEAVGLLMKMKLDDVRKKTR